MTPDWVAHSISSCEAALIRISGFPLYISIRPVILTRFPSIQKTRAISDLHTAFAEIGFEVYCPSTSYEHYSFDFLTSFRGLAIDLRVGVHHGIYCVGCCWGLMLILVALGVMNIPAMAALTIVIFAEKLLRHGLLIARLTGISFLGAAVVAVIFPNLFPGLKPCCTPLP